ncbi:1802_t:CDS:2, partial [Cetraspora pellucida]
MQFGHEPDEIKQYLDARYISAPEAAWRLFGMHLHEEVPNVVRLALHLPGMHQVVFDPEDEAVEILSCADRKKTTLTEFFKTCIKKWTIRKRGFAIGRIYFASPSAGERFYLRLLLTVVRGPQSFDHLRVVNGIQYSMFKSACIALSLLEDDGKWKQCLEEASVMRSGSQLRALFAVILTQ